MQLSHLFNNSVNSLNFDALPKKHRADLANALLRELVGSNLSANISNYQRFGVGVDTARIIIEVRRPDALMLRGLGFARPIRRINKAVASRKYTPKDTYFLNVITPTETIKLHWTRTFGRDWLSVECSLPKLMHGSNFQPLAENLTAIDTLSGIVSAAVDVPVNLRGGHFSRLDIFLNLILETGGNVKLAVAALRHLEIKRRDLMPDRYKTTVEWQNYGKKLTHVLQVYDKSKKARLDGQTVPSGYLRIESRYNDTETLQRNAKSLGIAFDLQTILETENLETLFHAHLPN